MNSGWVRTLPASPAFASIDHRDYHVVVIAWISTILIR